MNQNSLNFLIEKIGNDSGLNLEFYEKSFLEKKIKARMLNLELKTSISYLYYLFDHPFESDVLLSGINEVDSSFKKEVDLKIDPPLLSYDDEINDYNNSNIKRFTRLRHDRISKVNIKGELVIKTGHYALIDLTNNEFDSIKFAIYGLISSIILKIILSTLKKMITLVM